VLVDGHGQRLAVQELLLRRRQLGPAARRPRAPHPLAARHRGRAPVLLARHARERVAHWEKKPPRESSSAWSGRRKGVVGILIGRLSGANKSAKASKSRPEITTKSRLETSMGSCRLSRDSSKDGGRDCAAKKRNQEKREDF